MYSFKSCIAFSCIIIVVALSSCNRIPDHAKYIPKNAVVVVGVDIKALTKKVAWNAITGSKLFKDMQKHVQGNDKSFEEAGIDLMNTMYVYIMADKANDEKVTALIPLSDAAKFETYLSGNFPGKAIKQQGKIKTAMLSEGMYAGWNDKLLIIMNASDVSTYDHDEYTDSSVSEPPVQVPDETQLAADMQAAFSVSSENSLVNNSKYAALEHERHDILFWMNYEQVMSQFMGKGGVEWMSTLSGMSSFWKDAALTAGFDFEKGRIAGEMHYYLSPELKQMAQEFGGTNADKEMIDMLPAKNLDMLFAYHLSAKGTHDLLEKMGVLGFANLALTQQDLDVDYILDAFTGDMGLALNDFKVKMENLADDTTTGGMSPYKTSTRFVNFVYVMKINKKQNFDKLLDLAKDMIHPMGANAYYFSYGTDSLYMVRNDKYAVISNKVENATACLQSKGNHFANAETIYGHPLGFYIDFQQMVSSIDPAMVNSSLSDSTLVTESRKLLQNMLVSGGDFKNNNFEYHMQLNFLNKEENSLIQLMNFAMKISAEKNAGNVTYNNK